VWRTYVLKRSKNKYRATVFYLYLVHPVRVHPREALTLDLDETSPGLYKISVYFKAIVHESIIRALSAPTVLPTPLQCYCTIVVQCMTAFRPPFCLPHTITILVIAISCKGQDQSSKTSVWRTYVRKRSKNKHTVLRVE